MDSNSNNNLDIKKLIEGLETNWKDILVKILDENNLDFLKLNEFLNNEIKTYKGFPDIFPPQNLIFNSFNKFNVEELKVVIIGQDPYHQKGQAMGLSFSVPTHMKIPPSLKNIYKEILNDLGLSTTESSNKFTHGDLTCWTDQGVLLLNTALTVRESAPNSHYMYWKFFTNALIKHITSQHKNIIFMLWGNNSKKIKNIINPLDISNHYFLEANHPSPLSANRGGWFGSKHFSKSNEILTKLKKEKIEWII